MTRKPLSSLSAAGHWIGHTAPPLPHPKAVSAGLTPEGINRNHVTTPLDHRLSTEQSITVTDPRHPLCGRTLTHIAMTYHADLGHCCVVWLRPQVERLVPVGATNLAFQPNPHSPTPLSVDAVEQLLRVVHDIQHASKGVSRDASPPRPSCTTARSRCPDCPPSTLETPIKKSATARPQGAGRRRASVAGPSAKPATTR